MNGTTTIHTSTGAFTVSRGSLLEFVQVGESERVRVTRVTGTVMTYRHLHRWRWVEALHCLWEERIAWQLDSWRNRA